jgi:hypothetical protein
MNQGLPQKMLSSAVVVGCFAVLAWLNGRYVGTTNGQVAIYTALGLVLAVLGLVALAGLNVAADTTVLRSWGYSAVWGVVIRGFLVILPFTFLALLAELVYKWHAAPAFIQATIMTSGAAAGAELMRRAAPRTRYLIVSMIVAVVFSVVWTVFSYVFQRVAG